MVFVTCRSSPGESADDKSNGKTRGGAGGGE